MQILLTMVYVSVLTRAQKLRYGHNTWQSVQFRCQELESDTVMSKVQRHCKMMCTAQTAFARTCIERPPGPPDERQLTLVENWVQDVRGVSVGIGPKRWLPIRCFGTLQHSHARLR